jgi:DNA-binding MarR family transcriptional regulator
MATTNSELDAERDRIVLGLLESVDRNGAQSQRLLASELGIALGLVNAYLKRCVKKGLVKVSEAPARRYAYYLTPKGFAEKSRLTIDYFSYSFGFFRRAKSDCHLELREMQQRGMTDLVLAGCSDLAEIASICARETGLNIVAVVDPSATGPSFVGAPLLPSFDSLPPQRHAILVTDINMTARTIEKAVAYAGRDYTFVPALLGSIPVRDGLAS